MTTAPSTEDVVAQRFNPRASPIIQVRNSRWRAGMPRDRERVRLSTDGGVDAQPGSSCGLGQFGVTGEDLVGAESYCDGQVDGIVGSKGSECPGGDHVTAGEGRRGSLR